MSMHAWRREVASRMEHVVKSTLTLLDQPFLALDRPSVDFLCACFRAWTHQPDRLLLIADYLPPQDVPLAFTLDLDR